MPSFEDAIATFYHPCQLNKIKNTTIGIAGCGGIGSNCATLLVRSGFCNFTIADFDYVSASNLNRQSYGFNQIGKMKVECLNEVCSAINPDVTISQHPVKIDATNIHSLFETCDVIIEAFDDASSKALLFSALLQSNKLLIGANGIAGVGNADTIKVRRVRENCFVVGDEVSAVSETLKPYGPRVMIVAAMMANLVLEWAIAS